MEKIRIVETLRPKNFSRTSPVLLFLLYSFFILFLGIIFDIKIFKSIGIFVALFYFICFVIWVKMG